MMNDPIPPLINQRSHEWAKLRKGLLERIEKLRDDLERPGANDLIRGEIRGLRWLIKRVDITPPEGDNEAPYT